MGSRFLQCFTFFLSYLFLSLGSSVAEKPPLEAIHQNSKLEYEEKLIPSSPSLYTTQLDSTVPIVNPTPPGTATTTPIVNPITSPPSPTTTQPTITPPAPTTIPPASSGGSWCVANPTASPTALQVALDYACGYGGADCSAIQPGASCYNPNTEHDHASYAFNDYYHKNPAPTSCVFGGAAQLTSTDPSSGNCHYPSSTASTSPPVNPTPTPPMPTTSTTTPTTPVTIPGLTPPDSTIYGSAEPTGLPSSATSVPCSLLLLFIAVGFVGSLVTEKYL